jgi:hypothetical protein
LAKKIPVFNKRADNLPEILITLFEYQVPITRVVWYLKIIVLAYSTNLNEVQKKKRQPNVDISSEWSIPLVKFIREIFHRLQVYDHQKHPDVPWSSPNVQQLTVESFMNVDNTSNLIFLPSINNSFLTENKLRSLWLFSTKLMRAMLDQNLLDKQYILEFFIDLLEKTSTTPINHLNTNISSSSCNSKFINKQQQFQNKQKTSTTTTTTVTNYSDISTDKLLLNAIIQNIHHYILSELFSRRLASFCCQKLSSIFNDFSNSLFESTIKQLLNNNTNNNSSNQNENKTKLILTALSNAAIQTATADTSKLNSNELVKNKLPSSPSSNPLSALPVLSSIKSNNSSDISIGTFMTNNPSSMSNTNSTTTTTTTTTPPSKLKPFTISAGGPSLNLNTIGGPSTPPTSTTSTATINTNNYMNKLQSAFALEISKTISSLNKPSSDSNSNSNSKQSDSIVKPNQIINYILKKNIPLDSICGIFKNIISCPLHRDEVMLLISIVHSIQLGCMQALIWNDVGELFFFLSFFIFNKKNKTDMKTVIENLMPTWNLIFF